MDAIELIKQDHRTVEQLFSHYEAESSKERKREILDDIVRELSIHAAIEEEVLYPMTKEAVPNGERLVDESLREHHEAKQVLTDLDTMSADDPQMDQKVMTLKRDIEQHVQEEESDLLPRLEHQIDVQTRAEMGDELAKAKERAPTRPHPHAPDEPPGVKIAGPVAALLDRFRDRVQGRRAG